MLDLLKKSVFATIGLTVQSKEKVEELGKKIVREAAMSEKEGRKFIDDMAKKVEETRVMIEKMVHDKTEAALKKMEIPTRREIISLEQRVRILEEKCDASPKS